MYCDFQLGEDEGFNKLLFIKFGYSGFGGIVIDLFYGGFKVFFFILLVVGKVGMFLFDFYNGNIFWCFYMVDCSYCY